MTQCYHQDQLDQIPLDISSPCIIFLTGDLGAGKTTFSKHIINQRLGVSQNVTSPTYTYYNHYVSQTHGDVYHFDLYRLENYDGFFAIGAEEIFDNNTGVILVEWPELIAPYYSPDFDISIEGTDEQNTRIFTIK